MKRCSKCKHEKTLADFPKDKSRPDGLYPWCKACNKRNASTWQRNNPERANLKNRKYRQDNPGAATLYSNRWASKNPGAKSAISAARRARKLQATPPWLTPAQRAEMTSIYASKPPGYEVDHIEPLQGKNVCGLHVPWNLKAIPKTENRRKSNKRV